MTIKPKVSVLMPLFNCHAFVGQAISSILHQTFVDLELVIIDDCSTDGSSESVNSFKDSRIRIIRNSRNMGISYSRNEAISSSRGDLIAWLDSDDVATTDRIEKQYSFLTNNPEFGLCASNVISIDEEGNRVSGKWWNKTPIPLEWMLLWMNPIAQSTVMMRRSCLEGMNPIYNESSAPAEDYDLWCRIALTTPLYRLNDTLLLYRILKSSAYHRLERQALANSIRSNERYLSAIIDGPIPDFHKYITAFSPLLPGYDWRGATSDILDWAKKVQSSFQKEFHPGRKEKMAISHDLNMRLFSLFQKNHVLFRGVESKKTILRTHQIWFILIAVIEILQFAKKGVRKISFLARYMKNFHTSSGN